MRTSSTGHPVNAGTDRIFGSGEMAHLVRAFDWTKTALGSIDTWQDALLVTVNTILASRHPMLLWWGEDQIQIYNDAYRALLGHEKHPSALGQQAVECWPEIWDHIHTRIQAVMQRGESLWHEDQLVPILRNDRREDAYWTWSDSPVRDASGKILGVLVNCSETTSTVLTQRRLQQEREQAHTLFDQAPAFFVLLEGPEFIFTMVNRRYHELVGDRDVLGKTVAEAIPEAAEQGFLELLQGVYRTGTAYVGRSNPILLARNPGSPREMRYLDFVYEPRREAGGTVSGVIVLGIDVTERREAELALRRSEEHLQLAMEAADLGMWFYNPEDESFTADVNMQRIFGATKPTGEHDFWQNQLHPDDRQAARDAFNQALDGLRLYELEYRVLHPEGVRWIRSKGKVVSTDGQTKGMFAIVEDVTAYKDAQNARLDSEERLRLAFSAARAMGTFDWVVAPDVVFTDDGYCSIAGIDPEIGRKGSHPVSFYVDRMHPDDRSAVNEAIEESVRTGLDYAVDYRFVHTDGAIRWVSARGRCILSDDGTPIRFPGVIIDITERKLAEEALLRTEKLAAVGRLASSIAHEINNPLESVTNLIYLAKSATDSNELDGYLTLAEAELSRASAITTQTLRFHKQATARAYITCDDMISGVFDMLRSRLTNAHVTVEKRKRSHTPVLCFDGEIRQVLSNLVINAIDALQPKGGRLIVRSRDGHNWRSGHPGLVLTVADTGSGIAPQAIKKIFEPFFTTKGIGGTGLGLWISQEILERHGGYLAVRSSQKPGHSGTVFNLFLPFEPVPLASAIDPSDIQPHTGLVQ